jgi:hypothetical protein
VIPDDHKYRAQRLQELRDVAKRDDAPKRADALFIMLGLSAGLWTIVVLAVIHWLG